jgi:hypothetical protein
MLITTTFIITIIFMRLVRVANSVPFHRKEKGKILNLKLKPA